MKQSIIGVLVFIIGLVLLVFATMLGLVVGVAMLLASPFINRKLKKMKIQQENEIHDFQGTKKAPSEQNKDHKSAIIDGDFKDITDK